MTLAFEAANQTVEWQLGIDELSEPFVVRPGDGEAVGDMALVRSGLLMLDPEESGVPEAAILEAQRLATVAMDAACILAKRSSVLPRLPDPTAPEIKKSGWHGMSSQRVADWRKELDNETRSADVTVRLQGPAAKAARLGLKVLAEHGDGESDPLRLVLLAGEIAAKYSGGPVTVAEMSVITSEDVADVDPAGGFVFPGMEPPQERTGLYGAAYVVAVE